MTGQIVRRAVLPLVAGLLLLVVPLVLLDARDAQREVVELAERRAASVALLTGDLAAHDPTRGDVLAQLRGLPGERVAIVGRDGRPAVGRLRGDALRSSAVRHALGGEVDAAIDQDAGLVVGAAPVVEDAEVVGAAVVTLPDDAVVERTQRTRLVIGALTAVLLAFATVAGVSLARTIVRPIEELDRVAARLAAGDLEARARQDRGPPELRRLATTLNDSADEVQRLLALQRSFVADASHELRTPLASLRLRLESAQHVGDGEDRLEAALRDLDRLTELVDDLLALARAEATTPRPEPVDVVAVVEERAAAWEQVAAGVDVGLGRRVRRPTNALCVPGGLQQVVDNLIANALHVAPDGSVIDLEVDQEQRAAVIRVCDRGPGMSEEERRHAFERFWRAPGSDRPPGSGLGLSIAAELVQASGGTIDLQPRPGGGLIAEVRLPRSRDAT